MSRRPDRAGTRPTTTRGSPTPRRGRSRPAPSPPELFAIHPTYVHEAEEEIVFLADAFLSHIPEASCDVPRYRSWLDTQDFAPAYRWLRRMLQLLQWQKRQRGEAATSVRAQDAGPPRVPRHAAGRVPRRPHRPHPSRPGRRDPLRRVAQHDAVADPLRRRSIPDEVGRQWIERMGWSCDRAIAARDRIPAGQVIDVAFVDAVADPIGTAANILAAPGSRAFLSKRFSRRAWTAYGLSRTTAVWTSGAWVCCWLRAASQG